MDEQLFATEPTFSVSELGEAIKVILGKAFEQTVWVRGEIRSIKRQRSGHVYFDIVEPGDMGRSAKGSFNVVLFETTKQHVNQKLKRSAGAVKMADGVEIRIRAAVDFYPPHGRLQLRMIDIDPTYTLGRLAEDRERLLAELATEGLLDANVALPAPVAPLRIALITSRGSAAHADFMDELTGSNLNFAVTLLDTPVQGPNAPGALQRSLERASAGNVDLIALIRGGGSRTELATFDAPEVARAIARSGRPVWTGVGHEIDESIADRVAQRRLKTPTACAAAIVASVRRYQASVESLWIAIKIRAAARLDADQQRLDRLALQAVGDSRTAIAAAEHRLTSLSSSIEHRATIGLNSASSRLDVAEAGIRSLDPATMLARGWSITRRAGGGVVTDVESLRPGDELETTLASGTVRSTATGTARSTATGTARSTATGVARSTATESTSVPAEEAST